MVGGVGGFHHSRPAILGNGGRRDEEAQSDAGIRRSPSLDTSTGAFFPAVDRWKARIRWRSVLQVVGLSSALGVHSERSIQGFCWGAPGAQHSSAPCLRPTTCSLCPGDTSRCVSEECCHRRGYCIFVCFPHAAGIATLILLCFDCTLGCVCMCVCVIP